MALYPHGYPDSNFPHTSQLYRLTAAQVAFISDLLPDRGAIMGREDLEPVSWTLNSFEGTALDDAYDAGVEDGLARARNSQ